LNDKDEDQQRANREALQPIGGAEARNAADEEPHRKETDEDAENGSLSPFPPSNAMPPIRHAVTAESRSVSNPNGVALPSRTDETAPARPASVPESAKEITMGRMMDTPAARAP